MQYAQDYDEKMVPYSSDGNTSGISHNWATALQPYLKSTQIYVCPSDNSDAQGYTYNAQLASGGKALAAVAQVSSTPIYIDANGTGAIGSVNATNVPALAFFLRPPERAHSHQSRHDERVQLG